jgi:hypothetical protein
MCNKQQSKHFTSTQFRQWFCGAIIAGSLLVGAPVAASNEPGHSASLNKLALNAYCAEAQSKSSSLSNGSISYRKVVDLASERAFVEHPDVYPAPSAWKLKISLLLDQYGDDPGQLCSDNPDFGQELDLLGRS